jgi:peptidase E
MKRLALTSDFPSTAIGEVFDFMRLSGPRPRIAWMPPFTRTGRECFPLAQALFAAQGFADLEFCDIDDDPNQEQLARLERYDVIYLSGGDPIGFRKNLHRSGADAGLRRFRDAGLPMVGASGGAMQLTKNVSLYCLLTSSLDEVLRDRKNYEGLGFVDYELLPHLNRFEPSFVETVRRYSKGVSHDVIGLADGAALLHYGLDAYRVHGRAVLFRHGEIMQIEAGLLMDNHPGSKEQENT